MKKLEAFWHYVINEQPKQVGRKQLATLSPVELQAYVSACTIIDNQVTFDLDADKCAIRMAARDLSFALCEAFEALHGRVDEINQAARMRYRP